MNDVTNIQCIIIGETEKALMLKIGEDNIWIPKSTIHNHYDPIIGNLIIIFSFIIFMFCKMHFNMNKIKGGFGLTLRRKKFKSLYYFNDVF